MNYFADDYNRVVLESIEGEHDSDYVNASYVDVSHFGLFFFHAFSITIFSLELAEAECLYRDPRTDRGNRHRFLAYGLAGTRELHRNAYQNIRFHQGTYLAYLLENVC